MLNEPYYGLFLIGLNKQWDKDIPTAGVGEKDLNFFLKINPDFWQSLSYDHRYGLLKHEVLHIAFFHLTDYKHLQDKKLANIAMDIEINQYIHKSKLPEGGCTLEAFSHLNLEPKKGTNYYYEKLQQDQSQCMQLILQAIAGGQSGVDLPDGTHIEIPEHDWDDIEMDEAKGRLLKSQAEHLVKQVAEQVIKSRGTIPGEIAAVIKMIEELQAPKFDWRGYLRRFVGKSTKTYTKKSRRKYNKRMPEFPGLKIRQQKHPLVAIDTSGSVNNDELQEFLGEIKHIHKTGAEVTIIQCDTAISYIGKFNPRKDEFNIHGRGGTDFQPVIDYYNEHMHKYSCLFYLTDGEAPAPTDAKGAILWVLSSVSDSPENFSDFPGTVIQLN